MAVANGVYARIIWLIFNARDKNELYREKFKACFGCVADGVRDP
jgi:hypothetical protein